MFWRFLLQFGMNLTVWRFGFGNVFVDSLVMNWFWFGCFVDFLTVLMSLGFCIFDSFMPFEGCENLEIFDGFLGLVYWLTGLGFLMVLLCLN